MSTVDEPAGPEIPSDELSEEAARKAELAVPAERLYVNPSCGLEYVPRETAFEKLKVLAQGARLGEGVPA